MIKVFKSLTKGIQRSIIVGGIFCSLGLGAIFNLMDRNKITEDYLAYVFIFAIPVYVISVFLGLWIYDGFKNNEQTNKPKI